MYQEKQEMREQTTHKITEKSKRQKTKENAQQQKEK